MGIGYMALWGFGAKCRSGWWVSGYPLDCYDYKSTRGAKNRDGDDYKDVDEDGIAIFAWVYWATSEELLNRSYWGGAVLCMFFPYWEIYLLK